MNKEDTPRIIAGFGFRSVEHYRQAMTIAAHASGEVNEDFDYCLARERGLEVLACRKKGVPYMVFDPDEDLLDANVDLSGVDPEQTRLVLRLTDGTGAPGNRLGFDSLVTGEEHDRVQCWPDLLRGDRVFVAREVSVVPRTEMMRRLEAGDLKLPAFIKTINKGPLGPATLGEVFHMPQDLDRFNPAEPPGHALRIGEPDQAALSVLIPQSPWYCPYRDSMEAGKLYWAPIEDDLIVSDPMAITHDGQGDTGLVEYRVFVVAGEPVSASRYTDYERLEVPDEVIAFAEQFAGAYGDRLPEVYVMDVADTDRGLQLIELNPYEKSGRYAGNDPGAFFEALHQAHNRGWAFPRATPRALPGPGRHRPNDHEPEVTLD